MNDVLAIFLFVWYKKWMYVKIILYIKTVSLRSQPSVSLKKLG